jgi:hypothetical protein
VITPLSVGICRSSHYRRGGILFSPQDVLATGRAARVRYPASSSICRPALMVAWHGPHVPPVRIVPCIEHVSTGVLNARQAAAVRRMYQAVGPDGKRRHTVAKIAQAVGVHRTTVYDYLKREG